MFFFGQRQGTDQRLVERLFIVAVRNITSSYQPLVRPVDLTPRANMALPLIRQFRQHVEPGAHVFSSFGIVGRGGIETTRPGSGSS